MPVDKLYSSTIDYALVTLGSSTGGGDDQARKMNFRRVSMAMGHPREASWDINNRKFTEVEFTRELATRRRASWIASRLYPNHKEEDVMTVEFERTPLTGTHEGRERYRLSRQRKQEPRLIQSPWLCPRTGC